ncbi:ATP-binding protein [Streptomyces sp. BE20]|uniref:ATP-binding protein n=1 Tax=Streptomyces sp. BE20 TaxID=3002525 RepID=UPI002E76F345|nr:ATP-binding protein [Streptomyces sp. BE20]MEE1825166.1 ATP-binding protein [Streptomyces sp. BE20]
MDTVAPLSAPARIPPPAWTDSFPGRPSGVAEVRAQARAFLARSRVPPALYEDTLLVVSELVTNAVRHTGGPGNVRLSSDASGIAVTVSDTSRLLPVPRPAEPGVATSGLGLGLVAALCDCLYTTLGPGGGKTVHAHLPAPVAGPAGPGART